jgi:glycosyltransferase involved in cell wall biosynthesis
MYSVNFIIVKYFEDDMREKRLFNIVNLLFNIDKYNSILIENYYNDEYSKYINNINMFIENNKINIILCIDTIISARLYHDFDAILSNKSIVKIAEKYNYITYIYIENNFDYDTKIYTYLHSGLISSDISSFINSVIKDEYFDYYMCGLSFIIRALNEEDKLRITLDYLKNFTNINYEVIIINNNSNDNTYNVAKEASQNCKNFHVLNYPIKNARPGKENYESFIKKEKNLLANFYNWCFLQSNYSYNIKWDSDMLPNLDELTLFLNRINFKKENLAFLNNGDNIYVSDNCYFIDKNKSSNEFRLFDRKMFFLSSNNCENYTFHSIQKIATKINIFKEMKKISDLKNFYDRRSSMIDDRDIYNYNILKNIFENNNDTNKLNFSQIKKNLYFSEKNLIFCNYNFNVFGGAEKASFQMANLELLKGKKVYFWEESVYSNIDIIYKKLILNKIKHYDYEIIKKNIEYLKMDFEEMIYFSIKNNLKIIFNNSALWNYRLRNLIIKTNIKINIFTHCHVGWLNTHIKELQNNIDYVIGVNDITKKNLIENDIKINYIKLNHYIPIENHYLDSENNINNTNDSLKICFSGRLSIEKGIHFLVPICVKLKKKNIPFKLHVIGDGELYDNLKKSIDENNLNNCIILEGYKEDPLEIIKDCDIMIVPSIFSEGLPYTICEALSFGVMCIATDTPSIREILYFESNTLVELKSYYELHNNKFIFDDYNLMYTESLKEIDDYTENFAITINRIYKNKQYLNKQIRIDFINDNFNLDKYYDNIQKLFN